MKPILSALVPAIILHAALLCFNIRSFDDSPVTLPKLTAVTVTMSYRQPKPVREIKKKPVKKSVKIQEKPKPVPLEDPVMVLEAKPELSPLTEKEEIEDPEKEEPDDPVEELDAEDSEAVEEDFQNSDGDAVASMEVIQNAIPLYKRNPPPVYPRAARRRGYQGTVVMSVLVDKNGRVANLWVFKPSGFKLLDNAAIKAIRDWAFEPGMKGDKKVEIWVKVPVRFQLMKTGAIQKSTK